MSRALDKASAALRRMRVGDASLEEEKKELRQWIRRNPDDAREHTVSDIVQRFGCSRAAAEWAEKEAQK